MKADKLLKILEAAESEFLSRGLDGEKMDAIAISSGVSKRTLYSYFESKEQIYSALLESIFDQIQFKLEYVFDPSESLEVLFDKVLRAKIEHCRSPGLIELAKLMALNQIKNGTIDSVFVKRFQENQKQFEKWVRKCQAMKMISEHFTAGEVSIFFHALIDGHFMWPMILNQKSNLNDHDYTSGKKIITQSFLAAFGMKRD